MPFDPEKSILSSSALRTKYCEIRAFFAYFAATGGAVSLQLRLAGGARSLALTLLRLNSLLTGKNTGNLRILPLKTHSSLSKLHILLGKLADLFKS